VEGATETYEKIVRLKMPAPDGKMRLTDCADTETMFRIIQSIPSPKAEPGFGKSLTIRILNVSNSTPLKMRREAMPLFSPHRNGLQPQTL